MLRSQVGRIFFGLFISVLLITQVFPFDIQPVEALGPYQVATGTNKFSTAWESQRKLAIESDGTIHAVYYRTGGSLICQIYHAYSSDDGITWTEEQVTSASRDQVNTALAVDSQDNLHIVWQDGDEGKMGSGDNPVTYYRSKNKQGGWQAAELVSSYATYPSIAVDSNDDVHVVYGSFVYPPGYWGGGNGIRWKEKTIAGWQTEESLSSNKMWTRWPAIAIDGSDNIHIAWHNAPRATYSDTHYRKRTASGWETEVQVNTELDNVRGKPSIIVDGNNYVHIVWWRETGGMSSIRYRTYTTSWQTPVDIEGPTTYNQSSPVIAIDNLGHIHVAWAGQYADSPTLDQIRHTEYTGSWQPVQNLTSSTSDNQTYPSLLWARYPTISGVPTNQPENGFSLIWNDGSVIRFYTNTDPVVTFPDANLEAAIREALPKPVGDIYASELAGLTTLLADNRGITNLSGLEHCINLQMLYLQINQISDLSPLVNLTHLTQLFLSSNQVNNITPLSGLTSLTNLGLSGNQISDLTPLAGLTNLTELFLDYNQISDMTPLAGLTNLNTLYIYNNQISDLSPVAGLTNLICLHLDNNQVSNVTPLAGLTNLQRLFLGNNQISDLTPLAGLTSLTAIWLDNTQISDLSPLAGLTSLTYLSLGSNLITNLTPLAGLTNLQYLYLNHNQIIDILPLVNNAGVSTGDTVDLRNNWLSPTSVNVHIPTLQARGVTVLWDDPVVTFPDANLEATIREALPKPVGDIYASELATLTNLSAHHREIANLSGLEYCTNLTSISLPYNQITDLSPLSGLNKIEIIGLGNNQISDLSPLAGLTGLTSIDLGNNYVDNLVPLSNLNLLSSLYLSNNQVSDLTPLAGLTDLTYLELGNNQISDLASLASLTKLTWLILSGNQISDLSPLTGLTNLTNIDLRSNSINILTPIAGHINLTELNLGSNQISDLSPLAGLTSLTTLWLGYNQISDLSPLAGLTSLTYLSLGSNLITDLTPLTGLTSLQYLYLNSNQISDISPLVSNAGLATGDTVGLMGNPLNSTSVNVYIPTLQARGVTVFWDDVAPAAIILAANPKSITANGSSTSNITATVKDEHGNNVPDGTTVIFTTSAGSIGSTTTTKPTTNGVATATLTSSRTDGVATVTATAGDATAATAVFFTRPGTTVTDYVEEETPPGQYTVDAKSMGDIEVIKDGDGTSTVTIAKYSHNPAGPNPGGFSAAGDYVDVHLTSTDNVTQIEIRKYYTDDEIRGMRETTLRMRWWSGSGWVECSNSGVNTNDVNGYSGYVWAIITDDTTPCLTDLSGGMFAAMGTATIAPSVPPSPSASRASPTPQRPLNPAKMSVQYLSVNQQQTYANQPVNITTNVVNTGDEAGSLNVALKINGKVEQARMVSVGPHGTQPVKFTVSRTQPGTYAVDIGGQKSSFTVLGAYSSNSGAPTAVVLIAAVIVGLLVIVVAMLFRRRAY